MVGPFEFGVFRDDQGYFVRDNDGNIHRFNSHAEAWARVRSIWSERK